MFLSHYEQCLTYRRVLGGGGEGRGGQGVEEERQAGSA